MRQAVEETSAINFREVIEPKPVIKALLAGSTALLVAALLVVAGASDGADRDDAVVPAAFGQRRWPQRTHLVLDEGQTTLKVARGDSFTLSVKVRPGDRIPESAEATYQFADGESAVEPLRAMEGGEFRGEIESVNQPFHFTVTAGDDRSSIRDVPVEVVPPPTLKSLVIRVSPPAYTGIASPGAGAGADATAGARGNEARARRRRRTSRWLHAVLKIGEAPSGERAGLRLERGPGFRAELTVKNNFNFWFDLKDTEGFRNREAVRYEVRGFADQPPRVVIDEPKSDRDVPAEATIPVRVMLDDDFGLQSGQDGLSAGDGRFRAAGGGRDSALDGTRAWARAGGRLVREAPGSRAQLAARAAQAGGGDGDHVSCRGARLRSNQGAEPGQEPRDSAADRLQGRRGPPVRRQPPRAA